MLEIDATLCRREIGAARFCLGLALAATCILATPAEARHRHRYYSAHAAYSHRSHHGHFSRYSHAREASPSKIAAVVVDGNTGRVLYARNENDRRYPASITKVMTLYLLFEQLEKGHLRLDSEIRVSAHAAAQKPTKLGLRPGETISVDNAIKAVVTRSANDIAVTIAEALGGSEERFAELMTNKAHALGMNSTHFANASGLPNDEQLTTARDLAILGRAIQERFPRYYRYFSTHVFYYAGAAIKNHNHLLGRVEGMDGIKTGYIRASGFNLLTSVKRNGRYIVSVVLGGSSARTRDKIMADLIEDQIDNGATVRTAALITEAAAPAQVAEATEIPRAIPRAVQPEPKAPTGLAFAPNPPRADLAVDAIRVASLNGDLAMQRPRPAFVSGAPKAGEPRAAQGEGNLKQASLDGSTLQSRSGHGAEGSTATPSVMRASSDFATGSLRNSEKLVVAKREVPQDDEVKTIDSHRPAAARNGWMIQIGATTDVAKANELLSRAKAEGHRTLASAQGFTEKIQKGSETFYRARFAGLEADTAELACKTLKRSGFSCFPTKN
ncbi:D-alanyl-D-alanine carboxypeptidase [Beijerinckiaceae bacterium]|nr:D-alanyl-D-alanine carboxypeptidase [Beijerinckiaceae bacterium]